MGKRPPTLSPADAVARIRSGERVYLGCGAGEPRRLVDALVGRAPTLRDVTIMQALTVGEPTYATPATRESFRVTSFFLNGDLRAAVHEGRADFVPIFLSEVPGLFRERYPLDWVLVQLSPPDRHGVCTTGVSGDVGLAAIRNGRHVIAEINPRMPRTMGDTAVPLERLDAIVEVDTALPELVPPAPTEVTRRIGEHVAGLIHDGACLQIGIGGIPNEVLARLTDRRHLGIHTEMLTDGIVALWEAGAIDGSRKRVLPGKLVCSFALGTRRLYDFIDDSLLVSVHGAEWVNDPFVIAQNDHVVAVNSALQVDLTGQVDADSFGTDLYSGIGGQVDFIRGAARSRGGRPVIALPSTARDGTVSRIVPVLREGTGVVTSRGDVHWVVTEWGVADLFARGVHERAQALIDIAHPDFRDELRREAVARHLLRS